MGKKKRKKYSPGSPPGLFFPQDEAPSPYDLGRGAEEPVRILRYDEENVTTRMDSLGNWMTAEGDSDSFGGVLWLDIEGGGGGLNSQLLKQLGDWTGLHSLLLEDILKGDQRPKAELSPDYSLLFLPPSPDGGEGQSVVILTPRGVITLRPQGHHWWEPVNQRITRNRGIIRRMGPDYLFYALIDCYVDYLGPLGETLEREADEIEEVLMSSPEDPRLLGMMHRLRRRMMPLRRYWLPLSEGVTLLRKSDDSLLEEGARLYMGDVEDHLRRFQDSLANLRERLSGMMEYHLARVSHSLNGVMRILTVISTIFIPLTFIAGIYGMNFEYMPELSRKWAYPAVLGGMFVISLVMILLFRKKKWL